MIASGFYKIYISASVKLIQLNKILILGETSIWFCNMFTALNRFKRLSYFHSLFLYVELSSNDLCDKYVVEYYSQLQSMDSFHY